MSKSNNGKMLKGRDLITVGIFSAPAMLIVMVVAPVATAVIGAVIAKGMFKKHFTKAGIV